MRRTRVFAALAAAVAMWMPAQAQPPAAARHISATTGAGLPETRSAAATASAAWPLGNVLTCTLLASTTRKFTLRQAERHGVPNPMARGGLVWIHGSMPKQT